MYVAKACAYSCQWCQSKRLYLDFQAPSNN